MTGDSATRRASAGANSAVSVAVPSRLPACRQAVKPKGSEVADHDFARLSPFVRHHVNMLGRYSFLLPEMPGGLRPLRNPDQAGQE